MDQSIVRRVREAPAWMYGFAGVLAACVLVGSVFLVAREIWRSPCERALERGDNGARVCLASYRISGDERYLSLGANSALRNQDDDDAEEILQPLLVGVHFAEAHAGLSYLALRQDDPGGALLHATFARVGHQLAGDREQLVTDDVALSQINWKLGRYAEALKVADEALQILPALGGRADQRAVMRASVARSDALRMLGDSKGSLKTLSDVRPSVLSPCDRSWIEIKYAIALMEGGDADANEVIISIEGAEALNRDCHSPDVASQIWLNRAMLLRQRSPEIALRDLDDAECEVELFEAQLIRADMAADRGAFSEAELHIAYAVLVGSPDKDWQWELERESANLAELEGRDEAIVVDGYRRAIAAVTARRAAVSADAASALGPRRGPYDDLIAFYARRRRWSDALAVIAELEAGSLSLRAAGAVMPSPSMESILEAWKPRHLSVVIAPFARDLGPDPDRAYRFEIRHGEVFGQDIGKASELRSFARALYSKPGDHYSARELERLIVPEDAADTRLDVMMIGTLGQIPLNALRKNDGTLIAPDRVLARVFGLFATEPASTGSGPVTVFSDPGRNLPSAAQEGRIAASGLGPDSVLYEGPEATFEHLKGARDAAFLHVAGHAGEADRRSVLRLADRDVTFADLVHEKIAPRVAVLANCRSGAANDEEGAGSVAAALLESGTETVIAIDRTVDDEAVLCVMKELYTQPDARSDVARALARVQRSLDARGVLREDSANDPRWWAAFSVLARPPVVARPAR